MAGSAGTGDFPNLCRALGCRVDAHSGRVTVYFSAPQAADLLRDLEQTGKVAVVFSYPPTHRTIQLKGLDAKFGPARAGDMALVTAYQTAFAQCLQTLGFAEAMVRALLSVQVADLVAVTFTPEVAFNQTPGARAGVLLSPVSE